jgi:hypothetical protein
LSKRILESQREVRRQNPHHSQFRLVQKDHGRELACTYMPLFDLLPRIYRGSCTIQRLSYVEKLNSLSTR